MEAGKAFFAYSFYLDFLYGLQKLQGPHATEAVELLRQVYVYSELPDYETVLEQRGASPKLQAQMGPLLNAALLKLRPIALGLVEVYEFDDTILNSSLGRRDGRVYDELFRQAVYLNPINREKVFSGAAKYLRPRL